MIPEMHIDSEARNNHTHLGGAYNVPDDVVDPPYGVGGRFPPPGRPAGLGYPGLRGSGAVPDLGGGEKLSVAVLAAGPVLALDTVKARLGVAMAGGVNARGCCGVARGCCSLGCGSVSSACDGARLEMEAFAELCADVCVETCRDDGSWG